MAKRIAVKDLRAGSIEATPINVEDWSKIFGENYDGDGNQYWEAVTCDKCESTVVLNNGGGGCEHREYQNDEGGGDCEGYLSTSEGPMMNYWYKVDNYAIERFGGPEEAANLIADLPLCVVQVEGEFGLALTGGGMDLSWEICEAYTRIGQLPPTHFCELPGMAGRANNTRDCYIMAACRESIRVQMSWLKNKLRSLRAMSAKQAVR